MPTREQIESVVADIERQQYGRIEDKPWTTLTHAEKYVALDEIEWAGFTRREEMVIIGRILADEPPELWMEGINVHDADPLPSHDELRPLAEEIRQDEFAARARDYGDADAATYDARMAEAYRHRAEVLALAGSSERPPMTDAGLERLVGELERDWAEGHATMREPFSSPDHTYHRIVSESVGAEASYREPAVGHGRKPGDGLFPDDEPFGFQVWHSRGDQYEYVASVESNALGAIMMTTHGFMGYERWQDNPRVSPAPGDHRSTEIGDVLIGRDGRLLQIAGDDGLRLRPIASMDRVPSDGRGRTEEPCCEADAMDPLDRTIADLPQQRRHDGHSDGEAVAEPPGRDPEIRVLPGKDNPLFRGEDRSFDFHDVGGKIGHLAGYMGGPWGDTEFRVTHVEISEPGRTLTPGQWKDVVRGLREQLPDAEYLGGNRSGINGDLSPAYEKLMRLPDARPTDKSRVPSPGELAQQSDELEALGAEHGLSKGRGR